MKNIGTKITPISSILIYICLYIGVLGLTFRDDQPSDGPLSFGFPFPLYFGGGRCSDPCRPNLLWGNLIIDIIIFITLMIIIYFFMKQYRNQS